MTTNPALFLPLRQQVVRGNDERSVLGILPAQSIHDHQRLYGLAETDLVRDEVPNVRIPEDPAHSCNLVRQWISGNSESANQPDIKRRDTSTQCLNAIHEPEVLVHQLPPRPADLRARACVEGRHSERLGSSGHPKVPWRAGLANLPFPPSAWATATTGAWFGVRRARAIAGRVAGRHQRGRSPAGRRGRLRPVRCTRD